MQSSMNRSQNLMAEIVSSVGFILENKIQNLRNLKKGLTTLKKQDYSGRMSMKLMSGKTMMGWMLGV